MEKHTTHTVTLSPKLAVLLTLIFALLKTTGVVHWTWFTVFLPVIVFAGLALAVFVGLVILAIVSD